MGSALDVLGLCRIGRQLCPSAAAAAKNASSLRASGPPHRSPVCSSASSASTGAVIDSRMVPSRLSKGGRRVM